MSTTLALACTAIACGFAGDEPTPDPLLRPSDRVALVGGSFWEEERRVGELETVLTLAVPDVTFRHLGWAGDMADQSARRFFKSAKEGREHLLEHVDLVDPTVIFVAYGQAESLPGGMSVEDFETNLNSLLDELEKRTKRITLVAPTSDGTEDYASRVNAVAEARGLVAIPSEKIAPVTPRPRGASALRDLIREKNDLFLQRHRPQNETYLRGFRAHEQGNNAVEIQKFEPLVAAKDEQIQALRSKIVKDTE
ncbi:hypothetical protein [Alienimonas chondri]|uniref:SGNH hydrolase-type esterase domain-containing protein n=1 Tax=Alienimonas chondri TaxID=2681879 RepID=A0ABX1V9T4_9PLAN|nr:hypothetical protein [Alienimonas chondri]NNJ24809.1 hypothetical protein [Alienimonas chondri]